MISVPKYEKINVISLRQHPVLDEKWVKDRIVDDPSLLGLGNVIIRDVERIQAQGRLDLLLQEEDSLNRYEVEVQLGRADESHIIRTLEYWDIERKRYPQYNHTAVLVAEDITSRFLNVISLFNGSVPMTAIQMSAIEWDGKVGLHFTKVLDPVLLGLVDDDEEVQEPRDRTYWEKDKSSKPTVTVVDTMLGLINTKLESSFELNYTKYYIGLAQDSRPRNFVAFKPQRKDVVRVEARIGRNQEMDDKLGESGLNADYNTGLRRYIVYVRKEDLSEGKPSREVLTQLFKTCYDAHIQP